MIFESVKIAPARKLDAAQDLLVRKNDLGPTFVFGANYQGFICVSGIILSESEE